MNTAYLLLGSNLGAREKNLRLALKYLEEEAGAVKKKSSLYFTEAWGNETLDDFLNRAVCLETKLTIEELISVILNVETKMGRKRENGGYLARIIDIDILFFNDEIIDRSGLRIPHPLLHKRKFALIPMEEIAPSLIHPVFEKTIRQLLAECTDTLLVKKITSVCDSSKQHTGKIFSPGRQSGKELPFFIAIEGNIGAGKTTLAKKLAAHLNAAFLPEKFAGNPFLSKFYKEGKKHAFFTECWFLPERFFQIRNFFSQNSNKIIVADYHIDKCLVFAKVNLGKKEFALYKKLFNIIHPLLPKPHRVVFLHLPLQLLKKNIAARKRKSENNISIGYLKKVQQEYEKYLFQYSAPGLVRIDCTKKDVIGCETDFQWLLSALKLTSSY